MNFKINNKTGSPIKYEKEIHSLCDFAQQRMGFDEPPSIFLNHDKRNAGNTLGKTGYYDPNTMEIHVFATGRHPKDILRSIAHELVHHNQHMNGELDMHGYSGKGYAQKNPKLRKAEMEANDPMLFRDWEDSIKEKQNTIYNERRIRKMSFKDWKNKELSENLNKKWGFKMDLGKLNEAHCAGNRDDDNVDEAHCAGKRDDGVKEQTIDEMVDPDKDGQEEKEKEKKDNPEEKPEGEDEEKKPKAPKRHDRFDKNKKMKAGGQAKEKMEEKQPPQLKAYQDAKRKNKKGNEEDDKKVNEEFPKHNPKKHGEIEVEDGPGDSSITTKGKMVKANENLNKEQIVNEVMRRVAKRIMRMKKGRK